MEERKPLIPVKELAKRYALFIISLFISALGVAITKKGRVWSVADILRRKRNEPEIHGAVTRKLADNLELRAHSGADSDPAEAISVDTAHSASAVVPVRVVHGFRHVDLLVPQTG